MFKHKMDIRNKKIQNSNPSFLHKQYISKKSLNETVCVSDLLCSQICSCQISLFYQLVQTIKKSMFKYKMYIRKIYNSEFKPRLFAQTIYFLMKQFAYLICSEANAILVAPIPVCSLQFFIPLSGCASQSQDIDLARNKSLVGCIHFISSMKGS